MALQAHQTYMIETRWGWYTAAATIAGYKFPESLRDSHVGAQYWCNEKEARKVASALKARGYDVAVIPHYDGAPVA